MIQYFVKGRITCILIWYMLLAWFIFLERGVALEFSDEIQSVWLSAALREESEQALPASKVSAEEGFDLQGFIDATEKSILLDSLEKFDWNRVRVAEHLRLSYRTLRHNLKTHHLLP